MKIAVTVTGETIDSGVDPRFGRAAGFIIFDTSDESFIYMGNPVKLESVQGAGIQTARNIIDSGAKKVITGNVGPKAFATLNAAGIEIYTGASGTVGEALNALKIGSLEKTESANVSGHW
jgi:predicted Fe-Mo cluster-binding NifX family protein